jgi:tetratricopeptide (TPR) repeat protein
MSCGISAPIRRCGRERQFTTAQTGDEGGRGFERLAINLLTAVLLAGPFVQKGFAHGPVHEQIDALTRQLETNPRNARLLLQRSDLYRVHQDWDAAHADLDAAAAMDPNVGPMDLLRGRLFYEAGWNLSAKVALDRFLSAHTNTAALVVRARVQTRLNRHLDAAEDYARAIASTPEPGPEMYLERSQALASAGTNHIDDAVRTLDEGMRRLGPLVTLELVAIDLEVKRRNFNAALRRIDGVAQRVPRKETWLAKRGEILRDAGRDAEARTAFQSAIDAIDQLPPARRHVPAMLELRQRLNEQLGAPVDAGGASRPR